jgi:hypothetical protein
MGNQQNGAMAGGSSQYSNYAYRVTSILKNGPAEKYGLREYVDYIMYNPEVNQKVLLSEYLRAKAGQEVTLVVYNMVS